MSKKTFNLFKRLDGLFEEYAAANPCRDRETLMDEFAGKVRDIVLTRRAAA